MDSKLSLANQELTRSTEVDDERWKDGQNAGWTVGLLSFPTNVVPNAKVPGAFWNEIGTKEDIFICSPVISKRTQRLNADFARILVCRCYRATTTPLCGTEG